MTLIIVLTMFGQELRGSEILSYIDEKNPPRNMYAWRDAANKDGTIEETIIPFSGGTFFTSIYEPRLVLSASPKFFYSPIARLDNSFDLKFISWNNITHEFDYGLMQNYKLTKSDISSCIDCHKAKTPILSDRPWLNGNGANSTIGTYLSIAMLRAMHEKNPRQYDRYFSPSSKILFDDTFGNLSPETAITLGPVTFYGTPVFQLRGMFNLDANVRRAHYLAFTYQILRALPVDVRVNFSKTLVENALRAVIFPDRIDYLFSWDQFLDEYVSQYKLTDLPGNHSPILENYQPLFDNAELLAKAGITPDEVDNHTVDALMKLGKYVHDNKVKTYDSKHLVSLSSSFVKMKVNHNGHASIPLELLCGLTRQDIFSMKNMSVEQVDNIFSSNTWAGIFSMSEFPGREKILHSMNISSPTERVKLSVVTKSMPIPVGVNVMDNHPCLRCHGAGSKQAKTFPFDPAKLSAWKQYKQRDEDSFYEWANNTYERLHGKLMPPPSSTEGKNFSLDKDEWKEIYMFLQREVK